MNKIVELFSTYSLLFLFIIIWSSVWKAIALWKAARLSDKGWFIFLFIFNTLGVLELIYIYAIAKSKEKQTIK